MNSPHPVGVSASSAATLESVDPKFVAEGLFRAREKTLQILEKIRGELKEGMTEEDARKLCLQKFQEAGVTKHWHRPSVRIGFGTTLNFDHPIQNEVKLGPGQPYYIDLGPVWKDEELGLEYEGDYGDTFVFGENPEARQCAETARLLFEEARAKWKEHGASGEGIYRFLKERSAQFGYELVENVAGHRIGDFPHHKYSKERLARLPFTPQESLWVLEVQITDREKRFGAFFEDLL